MTGKCGHTDGKVLARYLSTLTGEAMWRVRRSREKAICKSIVNFHGVFYWEQLEICDRCSFRLPAQFMWAETINQSVTSGTQFYFIFQIELSKWQWILEPESPPRCPYILFFCSLRPRWFPWIRLTGSEYVWVCTRSRLHLVSSSLFVVCCVDWVLQVLHLINWPICFPNFLWHSLETDHIDGKDTCGYRHAFGLFPMRMQWSTFNMHPCQ